MHKTKVVCESEERVIINDFGKKFAETSLYNLDNFYMTDLEGYKPYIKQEFGESILGNVESEILYLSKTLIYVTTIKLMK